MKSVIIQVTRILMRDVTESFQINRLESSEIVDDRHEALVCSMMYSRPHGDTQGSYNLLLTVLVL